jgi:hypothetical protein
MSKNVDKNRLCWRCIGETFLRAKVRKIGEMALCGYCSKEGRTLSIYEVAEDEVRGAFDRHYTRTPIGPPESEEFMYRNSALTFYREGEPAAEAIAGALKTDDAAAEDIRSVLEENTVTTPDDYVSRDPDDEDEFSEESQYQEKGPDATDLYLNWQHFKNSLRTETRLFNSAAQFVLDSIFSDLDGHATRAGKKIIVSAGPGKKLKSLYRARVFQSLKKLEEALKRPDIDLGPPPSLLASAGRMNARGIAVFYGATHPDVAIGEVRPPVGSHVLSGRFDIIRPLQLLDVEALRSIFVKGSIFDPAYLERLKKAAFLSHLSKQITLPVMPDDEPFEYLVTQAIADYLANLRGPEVNGLIYRSVQHGKGKNNVVLFHKAALVKPLDLPPGASISASTTMHDEDGPYPDFWVHETVPDPEEEEEEDDNFPVPIFSDDERRFEDARSPSLVVDTKAIEVHRIERAKYGAEKFKVSRHRSRLKGIKRVRQKV